MNLIPLIMHMQFGLPLLQPMGSQLHQCQTGGSANRIRFTGSLNSSVINEILNFESVTGG